MAYKEVSRVDVTEVIRRWQMGNSQRRQQRGRVCREIRSANILPRPKSLE